MKKISREGTWVHDEGRLYRGSMVLHNIVYVIGALDMREDLEHRLVGVTDGGSYCILLRPEGL